MKRFTALFLLITLLSVCASCKSENTDNTDTSDTSWSDVPDIEYKLNEVDIINHETAYSDDFKYRDNGDGTCVISSVIRRDAIYKLPNISDTGLTVISADKGLFGKGSKTYALMLADSFTEVGEEICKDNADLQVFISGYYVTSVKKSAFENCSALHTVSLYDGLQVIEANAFRNCTSLEFIAIPDSVVSIDNSAFDGHSEKLVIKSNSGSYAETYAAENGITFSSWEDE